MIQSKRFSHFNEQQRTGRRTCHFCFQASCSIDRAGNSAQAEVVIIAKRMVPELALLNGESTTVKATLSVLTTHFVMQISCMYIFTYWL